MSGRNKLTFKKLYKNFKDSHPNMHKRVVHWNPVDEVTIELWFENGDMALYDDCFGIVRFLPNKWKREENKKTKRIFNHERHIESIELFSNRLKDVMEEAGITQKELRTELGISKQVINNYVNGKRLPNKEIAGRIANVLDIDLDELIQGTILE